MELRQLRYFVSLAQQLHFARAAELLHLTQPALSQQIKALEDYLEVRLFDRTKRKVTLTEAGSYFLLEAQLTLNQAERAQAVAKRVAPGSAWQPTRGLCAFGSVYRHTLPNCLRVSPACARDPNATGGDAWHGATD